ncbi:DUF2330 domain-containing protein [Candidatus Uabimicrobium amorphum]|uniref:DUF2330 domain-containing protein n=1 Tax=Uabimicrobium amorphum TaxID=2596890 RepID=A0A5S9IJ52_UABAM|nr:DUF2330 domain-containing protein [Candidatus Uabimicrobium amorphum]BBM82010.1 hypothetical protein UABAM_00353 [Candidatus Uabimicrobium amorphum]
MKKCLIAFVATFSLLWSDPCGMVPPIYTGEGPAITRIGLQKTYVFYKDGVETIVIRPGFSGKVDQFGMLIPFPKPPELRKVPDNIFAQIAAAIDPPEVIVDLYPYDEYEAMEDGGVDDSMDEKSLEYDTVKVLKEEAVGMYEVAVLAAGSAKALSRWMDTHGYQYPKGMDTACNDYIKMGWCFVAVKTRVGQQKGVAARPGMRDVNSKLPAGANFDGNVQGMGFRFFIDKPVVPMRLSTFNEGSLRNIVYILSEKSCRINSIPQKYVVRQVSGEDLYRNLTQPLPLRIVGGSVYDISESYWQSLMSQRDPKVHNAMAAELFAGDLLAASIRKLAHDYEEKEKMFLRIGEALNLRGPNIDALNIGQLEKERKMIVERALADIKSMTMTVVDGDFPREVLANENLTFSDYTMTENNDGIKYNARFNGKRNDYYAQEGTVYRGAQRPTKKSGATWWLLAVLLALVVCGRKTLQLRSQS